MDRRLDAGAAAVRRPRPNPDLDCRHRPGAVAVSSSTLRSESALHAPVISRSSGAALFGIVSVALSAPFVLNVRALPCTFADLFNTVEAAAVRDVVHGAAAPSACCSIRNTASWRMRRCCCSDSSGSPACCAIASHRWLAIALSAAALASHRASGDRGSVVEQVDDAGPAGVPAAASSCVCPSRGCTRASSRARLRRAGAQALLLVSVAVTLTLVVFDPRVPALQEGDGSSALLQWMSPTWQLWREAPTYVAGVIARVFAFALLLWLVAFGIAAWLLARRSALSDGRAALAATLSGGRAVRRGRHHECRRCAGRHEAIRRRGARDVSAARDVRSDRAPDRAALRCAFRASSPANLPPLFALSAVPGQRTDRQPVRVVLNARFRLPAGRYVLDLKGSDAAGSIPDASMALQLGREGRPIESWPLTLGPGQRSQREFDVPLDAEFVGFRAARQVEAGDRRASRQPAQCRGDAQARSCRDRPLGGRIRARSHLLSRQLLRTPRRTASG